MIGYENFMEMDLLEHENLRSRIMGDFDRVFDHNISIELVYTCVLKGKMMREKLMSNLSYRVRLPDLPLEKKNIEMMGSTRGQRTSSSDCARFKTR